LPLDRLQTGRFGFGNAGTKESFQYIGTESIDRETNGTLWDNITLTDKENFVIDALRIIEPSTDRIAFIESVRSERIAVIKTKSNSNIVPLRSSGDGINRVLTIILGMVNCDNGYFLLDEFENGLHYTVQEKLWKIIFELAEKLDVQVFATTHSNDCIAAFQQVLND
jgi:AAA15 family ATPase/GTPase